jgi:hypothetical protein
LIEQNKIKTKYLPNVLVKMRLGGTTNKSLINIIKQNTEILDVLKKHYTDISSISFLAKKLLLRLSQFFLRPVKK